MSFKHISVAEVRNRLDSGELVIADIRDAGSFASGRIPGAENLSNANLAQFMQDKEFDDAIVVVCYHGISSQGAANYLSEQGFENVFSMDGGFTQWASECADCVER
ncbi:thiosulfate sulfurtransferase GlpE [Pseudoalteromonas xiamenensis]|uniref:thiosulfate sulfurtransferase GlpE n=1 Tax=Pseudoalteromonas xiamenensis TaxID=882626 RepID=UPI0027E59C32|nr:thiosulfate sulfurtransferase GlpE [Pseudoalteromonas xiamenensis]WMN59107.1 thiosulfate sulfurtransferase GlpE [Pseudoalteromonas xiamenensis]